MNDKNNGTTKPVAVEKKDQKVQPKVPASPQAPKPAVAKADKVMKMSELAAVYLKRKELFDRQYNGMKKRLDAARKNIDRLTGVAAQMEQKLVALVAPSFNDFIKPLAKELAGMFLGMGYEVTGPTGIAQAITISFFPKDAIEDDRLSGKGGKTITIITKTKDGNLAVRDYTKDSKAYLPGSAGYASGLQFGSIPVPEDATVTWFAQHVK